METQEARTTTEHMAGLLQELHLDWVVDQVAAAVRLGIPDEQVVKAESAPRSRSEASATDESGQPQRRRRGRTKFIKTRPYTEKEHLRLLVSAIENSVIAPIEMAAEVLKTLDPQASAKAVLTRDAEDARRGDVVIEPDGLRNRIPLARKLRGFLDEIRREAE